MKDNMGSRVRERVWVEKVDRTLDPPAVVETVMLENGEVKQVMKHDQEAQAQTGTAPGSHIETDVPGEDGHKIAPPRLNSWEAVSLVVRAADDAGVGLEQALKFLSALNINIASRGARGPKGEQ